MSEEQKVKQPIMRKPVAIMATVGTLIAIITALNTFTGLNFRPAWGYEIEQSNEADTKIINRLEQMQTNHAETMRSILELKKIQSELQLGMIDREKWELRKELAEHKAQEKGYTRNSASVPQWLQNLVDDTAIKIQKLDEERRHIERKIQEYTSYLSED